MARKKKAGHFLTCYLHQDLFNKLTEVAEESMMPKTAIIETALKQYFDNISFDKKCIQLTTNEVIVDGHDS